MIDTAIKKDVSLNEHVVSYDDILDILIKNKIDMYKYFNKVFHSSSLTQQEILLKKYSGFENLRNEVIQKTIVKMFEKINTLKKEHLKFSLLNFLKYSLFNESRYSTAKEVSDYGIFSDSEHSYLDVIAVESPEEMLINKEKQKDFELLISHLDEVGLSDFEMKILKYKFFSNGDEPTLRELAQILNKKEKVFYSIYNRMLNKLREYYIINYDIKRLLNPADSVTKKTNWTKKELSFLVDNYGKYEGKKLLSILNKGRHKKIKTSQFRETATKLGLTDSSLLYAGTFTIDDIKSDTRTICFSFYEDNVIYKYWNKVNHHKILEIINFKRDIKASLTDLENRMFFLTKNRKNHEKEY